MTLPVYLKKPSGYLATLQSLDINSLHGDPGPLTYQRVFLQADLAKRNAKAGFWSKTTFPVGVNFAFRQSRSGMMVEENEWHSGNINGNNTLDVRRYWLAQKQSFVGVHTGMNRQLFAGKRFKFSTGLFVQGEVAIRHRFQLQFDTSAYDLQNRSLLFSQSERKPDLAGRNFFQWALLVPLSVEINLYKKQWLVKPELTLGWLKNRFLRERNFSQESLNAAIFFVYRRGA